MPIADVGDGAADDDDDVDDDDDDDDDDPITSCPAPMSSSRNGSAQCVTVTPANIIRGQQQPLSGSNSNHYKAPAATIIRRQ